MKIDSEKAEALVYGGAILGGGGGGSLQEGLRLCRIATELSPPELEDLSVLDPDDWVITVGLVGAPAAKYKHVEAMDYVKSITKIQFLTSKQIY